MDRHMVFIIETGNELVRVVAHAAEEVMKLFISDAGEDGRIGDLISVKVEDRQNDTVSARVNKLV